MSQPNSAYFARVQKSAPIPPARQAELRKHAATAAAVILAQQISKGVIPEAALNGIRNATPNPALPVAPVAQVRTTKARAGFMKGRGFAFPTVTTKYTDPFQKEFSCGRLIKSILEHDEEFAPLEWEMIEDEHEVQKAYGNQNLSSGGAVLPTPVADTVIEARNSAVVVRQLGCSVLPMISDSQTIPVETRDENEAVYLKENMSQAQSDTAEDTQEPFASRRFTAFDLYTKVRLSKSWMRDINPHVEALIRRRMSAKMARTENRVSFLGDGNGEPLGLGNVPNIPTITGLVTKALANVSYSDFINLSGTVENNDYMVTGYACHPRVRSILFQEEDANGKPMWIPDIANKLGGTMIGTPGFVSTALKWESGGTTYYPVYAGEWDHFYIGERQGIEIMASDHARFEQDQVVVMAKTRHDMKYGQKEAFCVLVYTE